MAEDDDTSTFDSGEPSLDAYLRKRALANQVQGASRCFVTCRDRQVVGWYALASASVQDFEPSPTDPLHLLLLMNDARSLLGS